MKIRLLLFILLLIVIPVKAYEYTDLNDTLKNEGITLNNYSLNDDQVTIYLFWGKGCSHCTEFLNFLNSIVDDYGKYFKLEAYEVWYNSDNELLSKKAKDLYDISSSGVPFIIIGDSYYNGYSSDNNDSIIYSIKKEYDNTNRFNLFDAIDNLNEVDDSNDDNKLDDISSFIDNNYYLILIIVIIIVLIFIFIFK